MMVESARPGRLVGPASKLVAVEKAHISASQSKGVCGPRGTVTGNLDQDPGISLRSDVIVLHCVFMKQVRILPAKPDVDVRHNIMSMMMSASVGVCAGRGTILNTSISPGWVHDLKPQWLREGLGQRDSDDIMQCEGATTRRPPADADADADANAHHVGGVDSASGGPALVRKAHCS